MGGVLRFTVCEDIDIRNCTLYGSGTYGIELERAYRVSIRNSVIRDCTYGLMNISDSQDADFINTQFLTTGEYNLLSFYNKAKDIHFIGCTFKGNFGESLVTASPDCDNIRFSGCLFESNKTKVFVNAKDRIIVEDCDFSGNSFPGIK